MITPKGNPGGVETVADLARPGIRVVLAPDASPPGGQAVQILLKKAGIVDAAMKNCVTVGSCVQNVFFCRKNLNYLYSGRIFSAAAPDFYDWSYETRGRPGPGR